MRNKYSQLDDYLNTLVLQNNQVLEENKKLCEEVVRARKEAEVKSEKLMLFIMTFMHRIKNYYKARQVEQNDGATKGSDVVQFNMNSDFIKNELDNYFRTIQVEEREEGSLKDMFGRYLSSKATNSKPENNGNKKDKTTKTNKRTRKK